MLRFTRKRHMLVSAFIFCAALAGAVFGIVVKADSAQSVTSGYSFAASTTAAISAVDNVDLWDFKTAQDYAPVTPNQPAISFIYRLLGNNSSYLVNANPHAAVGGVAVSLPNLTATPGVITVPITVGELTGEGVISVDLQVTFNSSVITPASPAFENAGTLSSGSTITPNLNNPGHYLLSIFQTAELSGSGTLINLKFNVIGAQGQSTTLVFENYTTPQNTSHFGFRFNEGSPTATITNGSVSIPAATATATNTSTPTNTATDTPTATETSTETPTATGTFTPTATATVTNTATNTPTPTPISVSLPNVTATPGIILVPITVGDLTGQDIISADLQITYDNLVVTPASPPFDTTGTLSNAATVTPNTNNPGHLLLSIFQTATFSGSGTLINLRFNVVGSPGQSTGLIFEDYTTPPPQNTFHFGFRFNEGIPAAATTNGSVTIPAATATNTATATETFTPTPTATETFTPTATATETFTPTATATETFTPTATATETFTPTATATETFTPTATATETFTPTATATETFTPTATATETFTPTATATETFTPTATATETFTP
ncbi:MAG: cohesin domain-containing protein, partial [Pyrinomonadaceae bacterium]